MYILASDVFETVTNCIDLQPFNPDISHTWTGFLTLMPANWPSRNTLLEAKTSHTLEALKRFFRRSETVPAEH